MKKNLKQNLKSNHGFTMQDAAIAIIVLTLFAGTIGGSYVTIYKMQLETQLTAAVSLYGIQILENIDKISYDEVQNGIEENFRKLFNIPTSIEIHLDVTQYNTEDTIKIVQLTMNYELDGTKEKLLIEKLKIKEL